LNVSRQQAGVFDEAREALRLGKPQECIDLLEGQVNGPLAETVVLGHAHKSLGRPTEAEAAYRVVAGSNDEAEAAIGWWSLANLKAAQFSSADAAKLDALIYQAKPGAFYVGLLHLARAEIWHQAGVYDQAFFHMRKGNGILRHLKPFKGELFHSLVSDLSTARLPASQVSSSGENPIFIVGQPRSGTTLLESILAAHSQVEATDELSLLGHIASDLERDGGYAKSFYLKGTEFWDEQVERYLDGARLFRRLNRPFFIDKAPENFLHIGLIFTLFPNAKVVHILRDPLDNFVSQYRQYFAEGREYSYSLDAMNFYWQGYLSLMKHWDTVYGDKILHISYERLVRRPNETISELLSYAALEQEPTCFNPHQTNRAISTPSAAQVREPINTKGDGSGLCYKHSLMKELPKIAALKKFADETFFAP
jgi:hypothetical protein